MWAPKIPPPDAEGIDAKWQIRVIIMVATGLAVLAIISLYAAMQSGWVAAVGISVLILLAAIIVGGTIGFLFAIPRVLARDDTAAEAASKDGDSNANPKTSRLLGSNTNLERVSDWLTTMLVGVGLSKLNSIEGALYRFRMFIDETAKVFPNGNTTSAGRLPVVAPIVLIFGLLLGFLSLYLYTRLKLTGAFEQIELSLGVGKRPLGKAAGAKLLEAEADPGAESGGAGIGAKFTDAMNPSVDQAVDVMYRLLYRPHGYENVIKLSATLSNTAARLKAEYWFYLAAAFGQKYRALKKSSVSADELQSTRDNALDCARRAVEIDPVFRRRLWQISDPNGPDDDLANFREDVTFQRIAGIR